MNKQGNIAQNRQKFRERLGEEKYEEWVRQNQLKGAQKIKQLWAEVKKGKSWEEAKAELNDK